MNIEYANYDIASNEQEFKKDISAALFYKPSVVSVLPSFIRLTKSAIATENKDTKLATIIDYPLGAMDNEDRKNCVIHAISAGVQIVELVVPSYLMCNRRNDKLKQDIANVIGLCGSANVGVRYVFDYSVFSHEAIVKTCHILWDYGVKDIMISTAFRLDDISDHVIAASVIKKTFKDMNIIVNGNIWNNRHVELLKKIKNLDSIRCYSLNSLEKLANVR